jgi:hypothetical protein
MTLILEHKLDMCTEHNVDEKKHTNKKIHINKCNHAGGKNTNIFGKSFENETSMKNNLYNMEFTEKRLNKSKFGYYLKKRVDDTKIIYLTQSGLKTYFKLKYNIVLYRNPDEAYIIKTSDKCIVKILEKKEQHCEGSVETKLWAGPSLKREYEIILGDKFIVEYAYCVNEFISKKFNSNNKKYDTLKQILNESNIIILHANKPNYYKKLESWIKMF